MHEISNLSQLKWLEIYFIDNQIEDAFGLEFAKAVIKLG